MYRQCCRGRSARFGFSLCLMRQLPGGPACDIQGPPQALLMYHLTDGIKGERMRRRHFLAVLGAATTTPYGARAQQVPVIGFLSGRSPDEAAHLVAAYRKGLLDIGYREGENVTIEYRWATD